LEEIVRPLALNLYKNSPVFGERFADITDVTALPNGQGYM
jgi:hypothetical protein